MKLVMSVLFGFFLFTISLHSQIQILAQAQTLDDPQFTAVVKHIGLQRWTLRLYNPDQAPVTAASQLLDDNIYAGIPGVYFIPGPQVAAILQGKVTESWPSKAVRYLGYADTGAVGLTVTGLVAAASPIKAGLTIGLLVLPLIQKPFQAETPSITTLMENVLGYPAGTPVVIPGANSKYSGSTHYFAYSPKFSKKNPPPQNVQGVAK